MYKFFLNNEHKTFKHEIILHWHKTLHRNYNKIVVHGTKRQFYTIEEIFYAFGKYQITIVFRL